jgi:uncharacterized protein YndB with AHSA1/START domain
MARGCGFTQFAAFAEGTMPYTFTLTTVVPGSPREVYEAWLSSRAHSEMTGGAAEMSDMIGAKVSAWDGYISGRNLDLVPAERIVQSWRTTEFRDEDADSIITITLAEAADGTLLTLVHSDVPDGQRSYEEGGWQHNYFEPMAAYFSGRRLHYPGTPTKVQKGKAKKPAISRTLGRAAKSRAKRVAAVKSRRAARRKKAQASGRKRLKRTTRRSRKTRRQGTAP